MLRFLVKDRETVVNLDLELFMSFELSDGDLIWNDYDLVFPIIDLYENCIIKSSSGISQAS